MKKELIIKAKEQPMVVAKIKELKKAMNLIKQYQDKEKELKDYLKQMDFDVIRIEQRGFNEVLEFKQGVRSVEKMDLTSLYYDLIAHFVENDKEKMEMLDALGEKNLTKSETKYIRINFK